MKNWIKFISFILLTAVVLVGLDVLVFVEMTNKDHYTQFFKEEENSIDMVFIGNSTVRHGFSPMDAWDQYGITTYNISNSPIHPEVILLAIDDIAKTQSPKVIYIDLTGLTYQTKAEQEYFVTTYYDSLIDETRRKELRDKYDYLTANEDDNEIFKYHNNFRNDKYYVINDRNKYLKGYYPNMDISGLRESQLTLDNSILELPDDGKYYLELILETCKKYPETKFAFGRMPRILDEVDIEQTYMLRSAIPMINEYGYEYFELEQNYDEMDLIAETDFFDTIHLNHYGAEKFTKYFVRFLCEHYEITPSNYSDSVKSSFDVGNKKYKNKVKEKADNKYQAKVNKNKRVR